MHWEAAELCDAEVKKLKENIEELLSRVSIAVQMYEVLNLTRYNDGKAFDVAANSTGVSSDKAHFFYCFLPLFHDDRIIADTYLDE